MKSALVLGAGGFIGSHMVTRLKSEGFWVRGVDLKYPEYGESKADDFLILDLRNRSSISDALSHQVNGEFFSQVYQFAADMGGAGFVFTGEHDADIMHNSAVINLNLLEELKIRRELGEKIAKVFYSSSACMYPAYNQEDPENPNCAEDSAYPAAPDSEYGWEKLFSERLFLAYHRNYKIQIAIARYHNIYGPNGTWTGGREKAPAAICRKVALMENDINDIEVWGDGTQTRSFLYIDECIEATRRLMESEYTEPINIGSEEMVTVSQLVDLVARIGGKKVTKKFKLDAPVGVKGRNSDNTLVRKVLNWDYSMSLENGLTKTYSWISEQISEQKNLVN